MDIAMWPGVSAGEVVSVPYGPFRHVGIAAVSPFDGSLSVISNSKRRGRVVEQSWSGFAAGQRYRLEPRLGSLPGAEVVRRARRAIGRTYNPLAFNCEHFIRQAHGVRAESPQLQRVVMAAFVAVLMLAVMFATAKSEPHRI